MQAPGIEFDPTELYAPVASHESVRIVLSIGAADMLLVEGADICCAYIYGKRNMPVYMEQPVVHWSEGPFDPTKKQKQPQTRTSRADKHCTP